MKTMIVCFMMVINTVNASAQDYDYPFSSSKSQIVWQGNKVVGGGHEGSVLLKSGSITFKKDQPIRASVVVNMKSIVNTDLKDPNWNKKLVDHLHSDDFFSTAKFPEARITIDKFTKKSDKSYVISGKLTIKGITKRISLDSDLISRSGEVSGMSANLVFDRTEFNIRYGSGKFFDNLGDKMISDNVKVSVILVLEKPIKLAENKQ